MQAEHLKRGAAAEALAATHLERHGLTILARNVRCRGGEVDLIAEDKGSIVFVEVRLRSTAHRRRPRRVRRDAGEPGRLFAHRC